MNKLEPSNTAISKLCETHKVKSLYAFGSVLTDQFNEESDVDLIVDFTNLSLEEYVDNYFDLMFSLEAVFKRKVDLLEEKAIKNPYLREIVDQQKVLVYIQ